VACFRAQSLAPRELVVVYESDDDGTRNALAGMADGSIRAVEVPAEPRLSLGALRNLGIARCRGHYVAQWDDDDWHAPRRIEAQVAALRRHRRPACVLARWMLFDVARDAGWVSARRAWEGSLVAERSALPAYPDLARGEDTPVIAALAARGHLVALDEPWLYAYVFHGANTWDRAHFERNLVAHATRLAPDEEARLRETLAAGAAGG
jgi:glycosyltransferase involved in cell wall biosynthesis